MQTYKKETHEPCRSKPHDGQVEITVNGFTFPADKQMVPLLTALNDAGLQTYSHCAGHEMIGGHSPAWVVLDLDEVYVEFRPHMGRTQMVLRWDPAWSEGSVSETDTE